MPTGIRRTLRRGADLAELRLDEAELATNEIVDPNLAPTSAHQAMIHGGSELHRLFFENVPDHAITALDTAGNIVEWNCGAQRMSGYTAEEIVGRSAALFFRKSDVDTDLPQRMLQTAAAQGRYELETTVVRHDGSQFAAELTIIPMCDGAALRGFGLLMHDVTSRDRTETLLRNRFNESAHLARLSTVGQMVAELAHEINQPLAAAANYARACINFGRSGQAIVSAEALEWMDRCAAQSMRAIKIAKRLGSFVKKDDGCRTWLQVNTMVEQVLSLSHSTLQCGAETLLPIAVETDFDRSAPEVLADLVQIEQVLLNLIRNAVEAMQELKDRCHTLTLRTSTDDRFATIFVGDTGPGIAPDRLACLFDPFFTTKASGLGLGLSISRSIVESHGGRMTVESSAAGTVFSFTLPLNEGE